MGEVAGVAGIAVLTGSAPQAWTLADDQLGPHLDEVFAAEQTLAAQRLALVAQIDARGLAARDGATSSAAWLRHRLHIDVSAAKQMLTLAQSLRTSLPATAHALVQAQLNEAQARVIGQSMSELPDDLGPELRDEAEKALLGFAGHFCPSQLGRLGGRILAHVAPDIAERHDREQIERAEARAWQERAFTLSPHGPGRVRLSGWLDSESAATVSAAIESLCGPAHTHSAHTRSAQTQPASTSHDTGTGTGPDSDPAAQDDAAQNNGVRGASDDPCDPVTPVQRRADALVQLCRLAMGGGRLPEHGGQHPQVMVMMPFEPWRDKVVDVVGHLENGQMVTPQTLRRMACDADVIPVVLGANGEPLDVGRQKRLFTPAIRKALVVRDGGCAFPGCDRPASWCDGHHVVPWEHGGVTSLGNAALLCRRHHRIIHENQWHMRIGPDGRPEFIPPSYVDSEQRPLRNHYHRRA